MVYYLKEDLMKYCNEKGDIYIPAEKLKHLNVYDINIEINVQSTKEWDESLVKLKSEMEDGDD